MCSHCLSTGINQVCTLRSSSAHRFYRCQKTQPDVPPLWRRLGMKETTGVLLNYFVAKHSLSRLLRCSSNSLTQCTLSWDTGSPSPPPPPCKVPQSCKSAPSMQQSQMTLMLTTRTPAMDYLSIWLHNRIMELEDELPCKPGKTSGVCVHLNPIYVFNGLRRRVRDRVPPAA